MAAFADAVKSYYSYSTYLCGIKSLEIRGTLEDWQMFNWCIQGLKYALKDFAPWLSKIEARINLIADSVCGGNTEFYKDIFSSTRIGSGGELLINGWFGTEFFINAGDFPKIENFPNTWSVVPFKNLDTGRKFLDAYGCFYSTLVDGFHVPDYGRFTLETE